MSTDMNKALQAWTCAKCGAALPAQAGTGEIVTCGHCGTAFKLPKATARSGGVSISGGSVTVGGDIVGGSKHVIMTNEAPSTTKIWNEPDTSNDDGVSINVDGIQIHGDVIGGSVVKIVQPPPAVKAEPIANVTSEAMVEPALKLGWREKIKRLLTN